MLKNHIALIAIMLLALPNTYGQSDLSIEKIMQDPSWMGIFPTDVRWDEHGEKIFFQYRSGDDKSDSLHAIALSNPKLISKVDIKEQRMLPSAGTYNLQKTKKLFTENGILYEYDLRSKSKKQLLELPARITNPMYMLDEKLVGFEAGKNAFVLNLETGSIKKLTQIESGKAEKEKEDKVDKRGDWLKEDNLELLGIIKERETEKEQAKAYREATKEAEKFTFFAEGKTITNLQISPNGTYVTFNLISQTENKRTNVPDYVDASGYTVNLPSRSKVGDDQLTVDLAFYHLEKDTVWIIKTDELPGISDLPDYTADYPDQEWEAKPRAVNVYGALFSPNGENAVVNIRSHDNKDRWICQLNLEDGSLKTLDRQRDEAWISGPGIGSYSGLGTMGWLPDNRHIYFQSEESGYSHLYLFDLEKQEKKALTSGQFEVFGPTLSKDKKSWFLTTSEVDPGERHFYKMPVMGGKMVKLTSMTGNNEVSLSPDEKHLAIRHSFSNQPWELYLQENKAGAKPQKLTEGQSEAFKAYAWREPELIHFAAEDGNQVPARLYRPEASKSNGAAVIFVHGAGYLQNVHKWWSSYFREYMFHNLLADLGYTVLDIDYRGSAGYGRDWRTGIYRHMGGKDLSDQVDGAKHLVETYDVDPSRIGIYGGSYGGFMTLMALFNAPEVFKSGAALRSVTDWAHYNHGYTSNILNEPFNDPIAYRRSSPIYFAEGLEGHLLIAHGMVDVNVHFQDVVRLAQRLIELEKDNWEMAVYPVEDHGFVTPSSWTDEYKRILKLFNETLLEE
ncbi:S9 family peptidase [Pararhodonellum marinum]|uniref:S9 family peptidase n=1 Tax=Pararhodonellum marinum TaxID=2755358 RepID=UPI00188F28F7|nr:prolyl oligopeptidase family serine peptidase [Pararhodonellum marinum]